VYDRALTILLKSFVKKIEVNYFRILNLFEKCLKLGAGYKTNEYFNKRLRD